MLVIMFKAKQISELQHEHTSDASQPLSNKQHVTVFTDK